MSADLTNTALLLVDLQNDFLHPQGAYGRGGQGCAEIAALPARLVRAGRRRRVVRHAQPVVLNRRSSKGARPGGPG